MAGTMHASMVLPHESESSYWSAVWSSSSAELLEEADPPPSGGGGFSRVESSPRSFLYVSKNSLFSFSSSFHTANQKEEIDTCKKSIARTYAMEIHTCISLPIIRVYRTPEGKIQELARSSKNQEGRACS